MKLFDVTEQARKEAGACAEMVWQVAVSRQVWERCVVEPKDATEEQRKKRLGDLLMFMRNGLERATHPRNGLLVGFHFDTGFSYPTPGACVPALLSVVAGIDRSGRPKLVVLFPDEVDSAPRRIV
jgi:hypothetical protein